MATKTNAQTHLTSEEHQRVIHALALIQEAQNILETACQALCPVHGFSNEWVRVGRSRDRVKQTWHAVEARRQTLQPREGD